MIPEITDDELVSIRSNPKVCSILVQSLVARLDRVEGERNQFKERLTFQDRWLSGGIYYTNEEAKQQFDKHNAQLTALRERVKRMEEALHCFTDWHAFPDDSELTKLAIANARHTAKTALKEG